MPIDLDPLTLVLDETDTVYVAVRTASGPHLTPELMLMVGHPRPVARALRGNAPPPVRIEDLTIWEEA